MEIKSKYFLEKKFVTYLLGKGLSTALSIISIPLFIRIFGIEKYGEFVLNYTIFLMALSLSNGWINQSLVRFYHENIKNLVAKLTKYTFLSSLIIGIIISLFFLYREETYTTIAIIFFSFILGSLYLFKTIEQQSKMNPKIIILVETLRLFSFVSIPFVLRDIIFLTVTQKIFLGVLLGYSVGLTILSISNKKIDLDENSYKSEPKLFKSIAVYGIPLSIWMVFSPTTNGVDRYLIDFYLGSIALAQYSAVYDIVFKVFSQLSIPLNNIVQPLLMYAHNKAEKEIFKKTIFKAGFYLIATFVVICLIFYFFKKMIIIDYLGFKDVEVFKQLEQLFLPLITSSFIWQLAILLQKKLEAKNKTLQMAIFMLISVSVSILLSIFLLPKYGFIASAYIMLISSIIYLVLVSISISKNEN